MIRSFVFILFALALGAQDVRLQVLSTSDTHGRILPKDAYMLQPSNQGWARLASLIRERKAAQPATLLLDSGDTISGDPVNYVRHRLKPELPDPAIAIMNALGYQAMAVGNHEFDYGFSVLRSVEEQAKFPFLSANTVLAETGKPAFTPYVIEEKAGLRVAILGLTLAAMPSMTDRENLEGLKFLDPVETARKLVPKLRADEKADLVLVLIHGGVGAGSSLSGVPVQSLAEKVTGIDLILAGHTHEPLASRVAGVPVLQAKAYGQALGVAEFRLHKKKSAWIVDECAVRVEQPQETTPLDAEVLSITEPLRNATEAYLNTYVTDLAVDLDGRWSLMEDTPLLQLFHTVMRKAVGAQLSAASSPGSRIFIPKGPTSVRQFFALAPYENRVARIAITGAQLRAYLEHAARFFNPSYEARLFGPNARISDYDMVSGVNYALDLSRPIGQRVANLKYQGAPVKDDQVFTLAITGYRLAGAGGYMDAIGFKGQPERTSAATLRNLILEYALSRSPLSLPQADNWRTIPWLDRERVLAQQP